MFVRILGCLLNSKGLWDCSTRLQLFALKLAHIYFISFLLCRFGLFSNLSDSFAFLCLSWNMSLSLTFKWKKKCGKRQNFRSMLGLRSSWNCNVCLIERTMVVVPFSSVFSCKINPCTLGKYHYFLIYLIIFMFSKGGMLG